VINTINSSAQHNSTRLPRALCQSIAHLTSPSPLYQLQNQSTASYTPLLGSKQKSRILKKGRKPERAANPASRVCEALTDSNNDEQERRENREVREEREKEARAFVPANIETEEGSIGQQLMPYLLRRRQ
jgi:hypothetical protein